MPFGIDLKNSQYLIFPRFSIDHKRKPFFELGHNFFEELRATHAKWLFQIANYFFGRAMVVNLQTDIRLSSESVSLISHNWVVRPL